MIGIVQGRLSKSPSNTLQFYPKEPESEFKVASEIGYDYIEFFSERKFNKNNLIWTKDGRSNYLKNAQLNKIKIYSFCDDFIISNSILKKNTQNYLLKLINNLSKLKISKLILPLYGKSLAVEKNIKKISKVLKKLSSVCKKNKIDLLIESNMTPENFFKIRKSSNYIKFVFDTGNRINLKRDMYKDIEQFNKTINHIHIKDKNINKKNVPLGKGLVDFDLLFLKLKKINYMNSYTIESTRGKNFFISAKKNYLFIKKYIK